MKILQPLFLLVTLLAITLTSCSKDDETLTNLVVAGTAGENSIALDWEDVKSSTDEKVTYNIYLDSKMVKENLAISTYDITGLMSNTEYTVKIDAKSASGMVSNEKKFTTSAKPVVSSKFENLYAPQQRDYTTNPPTISGDFIKFDFSTGNTTTSETDWDIAFRGTTIIVNGGTSSGFSSEPTKNGEAAAYITTGTFDSITSVDPSKFVQDSQTSTAIPGGSGNGWYLYDRTTHIISPAAGKILVFKTADGKYAKVEMLSYYKDYDNSSYQNGGYLSFNYVYQPNEGVTSFE